MRPLPPLARLGQALLLLAAVVAWQPGLASSLVAWRLSRQGLELKTIPDVQLKAYLQAGSAGQGPRVWVDFPGEPSRTRSLAGSKPVREVRIGRPTSDTTRLVIEFAPGVELDPQELRLVGTSRDRWRMEFKALAKSFGIGFSNGQGNGQGNGQYASFCS